MSSRIEERIAQALAAAGGPADSASVDRVARRLAALGVRVLAPGVDGYPAGFAGLADPPAAWFVRGEPLPQAGRSIAIVGSRSASAYGRGFASRLASDLAMAGYTIVSGLARGIDAAAHEGALAAGGRTVAVVPGGLDAIVPAHHRPLAERIARQGSLASERATGGPRHGWEFVERNRLIAALAGATVVVEAAARSGALSTAAAARRIGRPVFAVPGDLDRPEAVGTLALLRAGARPCGSAADVIAVLGAIAGAIDRVPEAPRRARGATKEAATTAPCATETDGRAVTPGDRLLASLEARPVAIETLRSRAGLELGDLLATLLRLEWAGLAVRHPGGRWSGATSRVRA
jgi:DNA processing protein